MQPLPNVRNPCSVCTWIKVCFNFCHLNTKCYLQAFSLSNSDGSTQITTWTRTRYGQPYRQPGAGRLPEAHEHGQSLPTLVNAKVHESKELCWEGCGARMLRARACKKLAHCVIRNIVTVAEVHRLQGQALAHG